MGVAGGEAMARAAEDGGGEGVERQLFVRAQPRDPPPHPAWQRKGLHEAVGVVLEMAALPMMHGAWITAGVFSAANAMLLRARITAEEAALRADSGYETLDRTPRFVPGFAA